MAATGSFVPFRQFVLKVHSLCDLACDHCYVYEHADQSWRGRPKVIASETVAKAAERIAEHARRHGLSRVRVILHGGEPLLAGAPRLGEFARTLRRVIEPACRLELRIHTNGVRLTAELCELFLAERVKVGISLDGDRAANDLHRRYANGRSSYDRVVAAVGLLRQERYRPIYAGLLATIDIRSDPVASYRALAALEPPALDFLLPHGTWDEPPPGVGDGTPYADWLASVHAQWAADGGRVRVRMFESIVSTTRGGSSGTESLGLAPSDVVVIEADGQIEQADSIKVAYDGAPSTGLDIFRHAFDEAAAHSGIRARQQGMGGLSAACRQCPVMTSCGGGLYVHRYRTGNGFDNPSVYCADLEKIITHVRAGLATRATATVPVAGGPRPAHHMASAQFDALAAGLGDAEAIAQLTAGQLSLRRALLRRVRSVAGGLPGGLSSSGWELIARLDREYFAALDEVLAHPYVRAWAQRYLDDRDDRLTGHLASIAAAAADRARAAAELDVPVSDGYVHLPTLGRLRVGAELTATIMTSETGFEVRTSSDKWHVRLDDHAADPAWQPVRELRAGRFTVRLEDTELYRDCHQWPAAPRLSAADVARWQEQFAVAWTLIETSLPSYAPAIRAGLSTLTPLVNDEPDREKAASAREAFGAIGAALPPDGAALALLVIHEFQHVKLGAVLDMFDLVKADGRPCHVLWRDDPRPPGAALQGAYAHIGVTDYWRVRWRQARPGPAAESTGAAGGAEAAEEFARWRLATAEAIDTLAASGSLTELGDRFVAGMRATVGPWLREPVPQAADAAARHWAAQRLRARPARAAHGAGDDSSRP